MSEFRRLQDESPEMKARRLKRLVDAFERGEPEPEGDIPYEPQTDDFGGRQGNYIGGRDRGDSGGYIGGRRHTRSEASRVDIRIDGEPPRFRRDDEWEEQETEPPAKRSIYDEDDDDDSESTESDDVFFTFRRDDDVEEYRRGNGRGEVFRRDDDEEEYRRGNKDVRKESYSRPAYYDEYEREVAADRSARMMSAARELVSRRSREEKTGSAPVRSTRTAKSKVFRAVVIAGVVFLLLTVCWYTAAAIALRKVNVVDVDTGWDDVPAQPTSGMELAEESYVTNVLLLGIDSDGSSGSRSDTMIIASVNSRKNTIKLCSVLRDNYVAIPGRSGRHKINAAYAYGGAELAMRTIESNYRVRIDKYVSIDMSSMIAVVEAIGGVDIEVTQAEADQINKHSQSPGHADAGMQHLDGRQALAYASIRKIDSDFKRTGRQRVLLNAIVAQSKTLSPGQLVKLVDTVSPRLTSNMDSGKMASVALKVLPAISGEMEQMTIPAEGTYSFENYNGQSVIEANVAANAKLLREFLYG